MDKKIVGEWQVILNPVDGFPLSSDREAVHMNLICVPNTNKWYVMLYSGYSGLNVPVVSILVDLHPRNSTVPILKSHTVPQWPASNWTNHNLPLDSEGRIFCSGHVMLEDGTLIVVGGHKILADYNPGFLGLPTTYKFDPALLSGSNPQPWSYLTDATENPIFMQEGRWYPTVTRLHDNKVVVVSGYKYEYSETNPPQSILNKQVEIYPDSNFRWKLLKYTAGAEVQLPFSELYPGAHMLPFNNRDIHVKKGEVFYTMPMKKTWRLNVDGNGGPDDQFFNEVVERDTVREHCNSVLLTLERPDSIDSNTMKVLLLGGHDGMDSLETVETINLADASPQWEAKASLNIPRFNANSVILPDKRILVVGGCQGMDGRQNAVTIPEMYDPYANAGAGSSTMLKAMTYQRMYHSTAILTPDATVLVSGGETLGEFANGNQRNFEIFSPGYLQHDAVEYPRPQILNTITEISFNESFDIETDINSIDSVMLIRFGCPTHAFDQDQRALELQYTQDGKEPVNILSIIAPADSYMAPAGLYMLFVLRTGPFNPDPYNQVRIPSVAKIVKLS